MKSLEVDAVWNELSVATDDLLGYDNGFVGIPSTEFAYEAEES